ncbi:hypothetical protein BKA63DRAFT_489159 [Paraphoma chrysanthemicola]|nr:hypothetical protein BKA63DRAFT_489159 [Paraphoma chrysanthemicola]
MQVIQDREAEAAGKAKSVSKASRLVREAAAKAAKAKDKMQKASSAVVQASKKRKATQSQNIDSGYSTADAKTSASPSDFNDDDDDEEGPVNRAKERIAVRDTSQDHDQKPVATVKKASKRKSSSIDDGEGAPTKKQKTVETVAAKKTPVKTNPDEKSTNQKAVVLPQARKIRRTKNHGSGPKRVATPVASGEYTPATPVPSRGQVTSGGVVVDSDARNASALKSIPGLSYFMLR